MAFVAVAVLSEVPPGRTKAVTVGGAKLLLCNVAGQVFAVGDVCTHDDGPLDQGALEGREIECPRHGARFDVTDGHVTCMPAVMPIPTHAVRVDGDRIFVEETATVRP